MDRDKLASYCDQNLTNREMAIKLKCSQSNVRYWLEKYGLRTSSWDRASSVTPLYEEGELLLYTSRVCKNCGPTTFKRYGNRYKCQKCLAASLNKSHQKRMKRRNNLIEKYKPRICSVCSYDKYPEAIDYHHTLQEDKSFVISQARDYSWEKIRKELDKCLPICANCHRQEHYLIEGNEPRSCNEHLKNEYSCKACNPLKQRWRRQKLKKDIVQQFGNYCSCCKQSFPTCVYDFHHLDSSNKHANVSNLINAFGYDSLAKELSKCILVCANCHRGIDKQKFHHPVRLTERELLTYFDARKKS